MPENSYLQTQSQSQTLNLTLNVGRNTNDPQLEQQVFNEMHSAGRQIGRIAAVLDVLISAGNMRDALQSVDAKAAIDAFKEMQSDIQRAKDERAFIKQLEDLRVSDEVAYDRTIQALRSHLMELTPRRP
ncbi:MAG: hypothetical protein RL701_3489 [Pseudomonadota bacterium]|jgi:hypothetical protein